MFPTGGAVSSIAGITAGFFFYFAFITDNNGVFSALVKCVLLEFVFFLLRRVNGALEHSWLGILDAVHAIAIAYVFRFSTNASQGRFYELLKTVIYTSLDARLLPRNRENYSGYLHWIFSALYNSIIRE